MPPRPFVPLRPTRARDSAPPSQSPSSTSHPHPSSTAEVSAQLPTSRQPQRTSSQAPRDPASRQSSRVEGAEQGDEQERHGQDEEEDELSSGRVGDEGDDGQSSGDGQGQGGGTPTHSSASAELPDAWQNHRERLSGRQFDPFRLRSLPRSRSSRTPSRHSHSKSTGNLSPGMGDDAHDDTADAANRDPTRREDTTDSAVALKAAVDELVDGMGQGEEDDDEEGEEIGQGEDDDEKWDEELKAILEQVRRTANKIYPSKYRNMSKAARRRAMMRDAAEAARAARPQPTMGARVVRPRSERGSARAERHSAASRSAKGKEKAEEEECGHAKEEED